MRSQTQQDAHNMRIFAPWSLILIQNLNNHFFWPFKMQKKKYMNKFLSDRKNSLCFTPLLHKQSILIIWIEQQPYPPSPLPWIRISNTYKSYAENHLSSKRPNFLTFDQKWKITLRCSPILPVQIISSTSTESLHRILRSRA